MELSNVLRAIGEEFSGAEIETLMKKADTDNSGAIEFEEFYGLVREKIRKRGYI